MARDRRKLGEETLTFVDGESITVNIHSVSNFEMMRTRRQYRSTKLDKKGGIENVEFKDEEYLLEVLKLSMGNQITKEDLMQVEEDIKSIHDKYFGKLSLEKKPKSTDMSDPDQDNKSKA